VEEPTPYHAKHGLQDLSSSNVARIKLEHSWKRALAPEFEKPYMKDLKRFLEDEYKSGKVIYPKKSEIFAALNLTPLPRVKAVILGQDPYHGPGQAHGLCFSVKPGVQIPPSLQNIFHELKHQVGVPVPKAGDLTKWATKGILLLNTSLTVERGKAGSHQNRGWETFTDRIIQVVSEGRENVVFFLWGSFAQRKAPLIDRKKHLMLTSAHPSPLSVHRGFFGNGHFKRANEFLLSKGLEPIDWRL